MLKTCFHSTLKTSLFDGLFGVISYNFSKFANHEYFHWKLIFWGDITIYWFPMNVSLSSITFDVIEIDDYPSSSPREQIGCFVFSIIACATNINVFS